MDNCILITLHNIGMQQFAYNMCLIGYCWVYLLEDQDKQLRRKMADVWQGPMILIPVKSVSYPGGVADGPTVK